MKKNSILIDNLLEIPYKNEGVCVFFDVSIVWELSGKSIHDFFCDENILELLNEARNDYEHTVSLFLSNTPFWVNSLIAYELIKQISSTAAMKFFNSLPDIYFNIISENNSENMLRLANLKLETANEYYFKTLVAIQKKINKKNEKFIFDEEESINEKIKEIKMMISTIAIGREEEDKTIWNEMYEKYSNITQTPSVYTRRKEAKYEGSAISFLKDNAEIPRFLQLVKEEYEQTFGSDVDSASPFDEITAF